MQQEGLRSSTMRKYKATTNSKHPYNVYANLLNQNFITNKPNQVWMPDIMYIHTEEGWLYLASIMDLYTRKIVGWHIATRMTKISNPSITTRFSPRNDCRRHHSP